MKKFTFKKLVAFTALLMVNVLVIAQSNTYWTKTTENALKDMAKVNRNAMPNKATFYHLDLNAFKNIINGAPDRFSGINSNVIVYFPMPDGNLEKFEVYESSIMAPSLQAQLPNIRTYVAQGIDDPTAYMRFSVTQFGLHTMTLSGNRSTAYIDPYTTDRAYYIVYDRNSLGADPQPFECLTEVDEEQLPSLHQSSASNIEAVDDQKFRTFRLAQTCTAEYGNIFATTPGNEFNDIMAQMTITINRVNSVYEVDLGITLQFIAQQNLLVFWGNTNSDPWNGEYNNTTQNFLNSTLNNNDYDIGHNFNTSGGGNAGCIGCVCVNGQKGSGMTGRANPTGDPFDIDYVAHEMGHQFGGYHVMNTCSRSGSGQTEVEPASGSSIMGYAGICPTNVQMNSDAHFNYVNVRDISQNVKTGNSTCAAITNITNSPPTANAGPDYTIPKGTAFVLTGTATDPDGMASLTYEWSQNDPAQSPGNAAPQPTYTVGPMYRAKMPVTVSERYFPRLTSVVKNNLTPTWEVTPSVGRIMNFSFMVRDNDVQGGQTADDLMKVTVDGNSGPFTVTSQTSNITWNEGTTETITWNVANTNNAPVNCSNVDILLSLDSGYTYPFTLASGVPNNGSANITVPTGAATTTARIMVKGSNNVFYALNSSIFTIQASEFVMNFAPSATNNDVCAPGTATYNFTYNTFLGFNQVTTFSATGNPPGTTVTFNPATAQNDNTPVTITISGITPAMVGSYNITVTGTASTVTKNTNITLNVYSATFNTTTLNSPSNGATGVLAPYNFTWTADPNASSYEIDIATDAAFTNIVDNATGLTTNSYSSTVLISNTTYYWRVRPVNQCATGSNSSTFSFTTSSCNTYASTNVPVNVGASSVTSTINVTASGTVLNVNIPVFQLTHTWVGDLSATLTSPMGTTIQLFDGPGIPASTYGCDGDDIDCSFNDAAASTSTDFENMCNNAPAISGAFQPMQSFSAFNGETITGTWTLTILDSYTASDNGSLDNWSLEICTNPTVTSVNELDKPNIYVFPNPTEGLVYINTDGNANLNITVLSIDGKTIKTLNNVNDKQITIDLANQSKGMYIIKIENGNTVQFEKIIKQ